MLKIEPLDIPGVVGLTPRRFGDERGFFAETWNSQRLKENGFDIEFVQDNHSVSKEKYTVRGLHAQAPPYAQTKLVRCGRGAFLDVAVDIRIGSPTYGCWTSIVLSAENGKQLLIPDYCLHGLMTLEPDTEVIYKCSNYYAPDHELAVRFDDPTINIDWGIKTSQISLSEKDQTASPFSEFQSPFQSLPENA